ncbi:MAG: hypothetical protein GF309_08910 [Candidatus Lokiarchaeota archaeon]|nr:hypothetical protein [Candidatus Lokiarchaeota archaeon]
MTRSEKRETALSLLESSDSVSRVIVRIQNEPYLRNDKSIHTAIYKRKDILFREIENSSNPWSIIESVLWLPGVAEWSEFRKAVAGTLTSKDSPWYTINLLKSHPNLLYSDEILSAIASALEKTKRFWLFVDHLRTHPKILQLPKVQSSITKRISIAADDIRNSKTPLSIIQILKSVPDAFEQDSVQRAIEHVIVNHSKPWEVIRSIEDIPGIDNVIECRRVLDAIDEHASDIVEKIKASSEPHRIFEDAVKIPELARTQVLRNYAIERVLTYWSPSSVVSDIIASDILSAHEKVQDAIGRALIATPDPVNLLSTISYNTHLLNCSAIRNAIDLRLDDIISTTENPKDPYDTYPLFYLVRVIESVPQIGNNEKMIKSVAKWIEQSPRADKIIGRFAEKTSYIKHPTIQRSIANAILKHANPIEIVNELAKSDNLEPPVIRKAIKSRAKVITTLLESGESEIEKPHLIEEIVGDNYYIPPIVSRLLESESTDDIMEEILDKPTYYRNTTIQNAVAQALLDPNKCIDILNKLWGNTLKGAKSFIISNTNVQHSIAEVVRSTEELEYVLDRISSFDDLWLLLVNPEFNSALEDRSQDVAALIEQSRQPQSIVEDICKFPTYTRDEQIQLAIASKLDSPSWFEDLVKRIKTYYSGYPPGFRESKILKEAISNSGDILLKLLQDRMDREQIFTFVMRAYDPSMLKNEKLVDWLAQHISNPDLDLWSHFLNKESMAVTKNTDAIVKILKQVEISDYLCLWIYENALHKENDELNEILKEKSAEIFGRLKKTENPEDFVRYIPLLREYVGDKKVDGVLKKNASNLANRIRAAETHSDLKDVISAALLVPLWKTDSSVVDAIAGSIAKGRVDSFQMYRISHDETLSLEDEINEATAKAILSASKPEEITNYFGRYHSIESEIVKRAVLDQMDLIIQALNESEKPRRYLERFSGADFIFNAPKMKAALEPRLDEIIMDIGDIWPYVPLAMENLPKMDVLLNHPKLYKLVLDILKQSYEPWEMIEAIRPYKSFLEDENISQAIESRIDYIAGMIERVPEPNRIVRCIEGVSQLNENPAIQAAIEKRVEKE